MILLGYIAFFDPPKETAAEALKVLYAAGLPIADVAVHTSSLEDVLLRVLRGPVKN